MEEVRFVPVLDIKTLTDITNCIAQEVDRKTDMQIGFYQISVWFSDIANKLRHANCPPNGYSIFTKTVLDFGHPSLHAHAMKIWEKGLVPIEIVQSTGAVYYAIPKSVVNEKKVRNYIILCAETDIPNIEDFEDLNIKPTFEEICDLYRFEISDMRYGIIKDNIENRTAEENLMDLLMISRELVIKGLDALKLIVMIKDMTFGEYNLRPCALLEKIVKAIYTFDMCDKKETVPDLYIENMHMFKVEESSENTPIILIKLYMGLVITINANGDKEVIEIYREISKKLNPVKHKE